jgi:hypothetical protein
MENVEPSSKGGYTVTPGAREDMSTSRTDPLFLTSEANFFSLQKEIKK